MPAPKQIDEFSQLLEEVQSKSNEASNVLQSLLDKVKKDDFSTDAGLSFLELKNHMLLDYLTNLTYIMLRKTSGKSISGDDAIERIVEDRTVIEKLRPIEKKLKYQIDKAIKVAESGQLPANDPLSFKPNLGALQDVNNDDDDDNSEDEDEDMDESSNTPNQNQNKSGGKYVPPKNVPAFMDDAETLEKNEEEKQKKRSLSKSIMEDLKRQHLDLPDEEHSAVDTVKAKHIAKIKERIRYEEENFMRLPLSKKEKHKRRQMTTIGSLGDEITYFGNDNFYNDPKSKKRKTGGGGGGSRKFNKGSGGKKFKKH